ncbi:NAD(P)/FAD-dependent oxidoreductase [Pseudoxanthomonas spadix]|uniref:NAD(P)/FAD-dependent oxidoreductase n=1 Tax=Pseudoxanthomonas spadix TaxID=415229 RepID=UPI000EFEB8C8|nr:FAD-dependent oxidoreductase [Pseudoxanthomonas spadix]MBP3974906.1 FAD-dependent oxidoreductase [Pseudoxanthomonas spadix]RMW98370.1 FAD-dependent oxidoreductase [Pseudoxanthomonas spadix]
MSRIAVVGGGIAGMGAAWALSQRHAVTLFEAGDRLGGHTHTHDIQVGGRHYPVDTGFIVFNPDNYPLLARLLETLGVASQPTTMSFSVSHAGTGLEYNAGNLAGLFCQKRNLVSPRFWKMLADLRRFYRQSPAVLELPAPGPTLGQYLDAHGYSATFRDAHIVPMASALWSSPSKAILDFPMQHLVRFMRNHHMLQLSGRPQWRVVSGGSSSYVQALQSTWKVQVRLAEAVHALRRVETGVEVQTADCCAVFDEVVLACHADDSLRLLTDAAPDEQQILGAITYQANETVLHTDARVLPRDRRAWAAWNAQIAASDEGQCMVSYWMNALQSLDAPVPFIVSLNQGGQIDEAKVLRRISYRHPHQTPGSVAAQQALPQIQGRGHLWHAGAGWGFGFHEDGLRSGIEVARALGITWP